MKRDFGNLILYLIIAFVLPLIMVFLSQRIANEWIGLLLYGIQAASPSIAALAVWKLNKELKPALSRLFHKDTLVRAIVLPVLIVYITMPVAKYIACIAMKDFSSFWVRGSVTQMIIIFWSLFAEEFGWRGFYEPQLVKLGIKKYTAPLFVGITWCAWHYHFFLQNGMEVPITLFLFGCIAESYICSLLMRVTENNLVSAMTFHFMLNFMIHLAGINPSDNGGSLTPYIAMTELEAAVALVFGIVLKYRERKAELPALEEEGPEEDHGKPEELKEAN